MRGNLTDLDGTGRHWRLRIYLGRSASGAAVQRSANFKGTRLQAEAALRRFMAEADGTSHAGGTFRDLVERWWEQAEARRAPSTLIGYRRKLDHDILPAFGHYRLERLTPAVLDHQYRAWQRDGLAPATVRQLHAIVSAVLAQGVKWGWLSESPAKRTSPPSVYRPRRKALSLDELQAMLSRAELDGGRGSVLATAVALGALTGARRGELCALRWSDWDGSEQLHVARALTVLKGGEPKEGPTKTHQERTVVLDVVAVEVLRRRREAQEMGAEVAGTTLVGDAFILSRSPDGADPCLPDGLTHGFTALVDTLWPRAKGQKPRWHLHDLRHAVATLALASGADARTVADRLGHADPSVTLRIYAHTIDEASRQLAAALGSAVGRALPPA